MSTVAEHVYTELEHSDVAIPQSWEMTGAQVQLALLTPDSLTNLSAAERQQVCQRLFGELRRCYRQITEQATRVRERVMADQLQGDAAIMSRPYAGDTETARAMALAAVTDWFYHDGQDEKETTVHTGAIACSRETLGALAELNRRKDAFSDVLAKMRAVMEDEDSKGEMAKLYAAIAPESPLNVRRKVVGVIARNCIHKRLNIRQLVRHVPVVPVCPDRIRWRWIQTPSTMRVSRDALLDLLESKQDTQARFDLELVAKCTDPEFSWQKGVSEDCRIGVLCKSATEWPDNDWDQKNLSFKGRMPIFYLAPRLADYIEKPKPRKNASKKRIKPELITATEDQVQHERKGKTEKRSFLQSMMVRRYLHYVEREQFAG